jgi:sulfate permease, SulP family
MLPACLRQGGCCHQYQKPPVLQDSFFRPYSGSLVRLVLLCAAIHQAVFTMLSSIKFAVGQVQDVGLIFLSAIASRYAALM